MRKLEATSPLANVCLSVDDYDDLNLIQKFKSKLSRIIGSEQFYSSDDSNIRPKGDRKYNEMSEKEIAVVARKNYQNLRWFHGTRTDNNANSILKTGLSAPNCRYNYIAKHFDYSYKKARYRSERVFRVFLDPKLDKLVNYFGVSDESVARTSSKIARDRLATQDPETIGAGADALFYREMHHDIPDITREQAKSALRRYGSFHRSEQSDVEAI
jgi:hypothetical protein